jgi:hypothetical protein
MATKKQQINTENLPKILKGLKKQVVSLGQIHYESKNEENFKEWRQRTLYLVNAAFGQGQRCDDLEDAIDSMPEKNTTKGSYGSERYIYWLETEDGDEGEFNQERWDEDYKKAKNWIQKLIKLYIEELELLSPPTEPKARSGSKNTLIATQITDVKIDIKTEVKNLVSYIHENESDPQKAEEAESKVKELGEELQKDTTKWSVVKDILIWIANYSKDLFIKVLPILLNHYGK